MRNPLRRLWSRQPSATSLGLDLAQGDWTPPPPSEVGSTNWADWLVEEPPRRAPAPRPLERSAELLSLNLPSTVADQSDDIVGIWAEPDPGSVPEARVADAVAGSAPEEASAAAVAEPVPEVVTGEPVPAPRRRRNTVGGGRARTRTLPPDRRFREVMTSEFAELLTDEELSIIRSQMGK